MDAERGARISRVLFVYIILYMLIFHDHPAPAGAPLHRGELGMMNIFTSTTPIPLWGGVPRRAGWSEIEEIKIISFNHCA
jgi:hypothetical protein